MYINLALIGAVTIFIIALVIFKSTKILNRLNNEILKTRDKENKEYSELYNKNKLTYLFNLQENNIKRTKKLLDEELYARKKYITIHHFPYWIITILQTVGIYAIMYYVLNIETAISLGSIYLVLFYTKECKSPLEEISNQLEELQTCINSYKKINALLNETNDELIEKGEYIEDLNRKYI